MDDQESGKPRESTREALNKAGYLWRPGSSPQDDPLHVTVALVIGLILLGCVLLAVLT